MAQELLTTFEDSLGEVAIVPGGRGMFEVWLDGECLYSCADVGDFPSPKQIKQ